MKSMKTVEFKDDNRTMVVAKGFSNENEATSAIDQFLSECGEVYGRAAVGYEEDGTWYFSISQAERTTIYKIIGGGQRVRQMTNLGRPVGYIKDENSDLPERTNLTGQDHFTHLMWFTDFETLQKRANEWAGKEVKLVQVEEVE